MATSSNIVVASTNPVKIKGALEGFSCMFPQTKYGARGVKTPSGVSDQPFTSEETLLGAQNRVQNAKKLEPAADYWIGIEGGVEEHGGVLLLFAWIVILDKEGREGKARTASFYLPEEISKLVRSGMELGDAQDQVFVKTNSKQHNGTVGLLTDDVIDRSATYATGVIMALIPFKNKNLTF
ncbi:Maf/Ham1 [Tothia fuscella]|uniref:inosine/xanthosine triphosphatase n=1 Tax=Tothia fuscella TaxID=1048955 RepID=A0A9P4NLP1_9PEZI|nr:Maf/Ham1 [Tothia fuscella]